MSEIQTVILSFLTGGGAASLIVWLARNWISERIKNSIRHEYDAKLETHKAQLQLAAAERSIRFSKVFEETADTVIETYKRLLALSDAVTAYTSIIEFNDSGTKAERRVIVAQRLKEFDEYYRPRKPYLPQETASQIDDLRKRLHSTTVKFMLKVEQGRESNREDPKVDHWMDAHNEMEKEFPPILTLLEQDFRMILGVGASEKKK